MIKNLTYICVMISCFCASAQDSLYFVHFNSKVGTPYSISTPESFLSSKSILRRAKQGIEITEKDLPVNPAFKDSLSFYGLNVIYTSRWMNGALVSASDAEKAIMMGLPFVSGIAFNKALKVSSGISGARKSSSKFVNETSSMDYGSSLSQMALMGALDMHEAGFHGEGMLIAVIDNGFLNSNTISCLDTLFENNSVLEVYDFVDNDSMVFSQGGHGTNVLSCMAAYTEGSLISPAYKAQYVLYRTEDDATETHAEEIFWLIAAERADSIGVDVINTSLGYSTFDNPLNNYTPEEMDGNTAFITKAADLAASTGMLIVNSAGNSGNFPWHIVTAPADADSILAVGAVAIDSTLSSFSSRGPAADGRIKPDLVAVGLQTFLGNTNGSFGFSNGTSFSAPLLAAFATCIWQANPYLSAQELKRVLIKSGHMHHTPNNDFGYGIPNWLRADSIAKTDIGPLALKPHNDIHFVELSPDSPVEMVLKFDAAMIGDSILLQLFNLNLQETQYTETFTLADTLKIVSLPVNSFSNNLLIRIENLTHSETIALYKF